MLTGTVDLQELIQICETYELPFSMTTDDKYVYYCFGNKLKWAKMPNTLLDVEDLLCIVQRLAAMYPEKILVPVGNNE